MDFGENYGKCAGCGEYADLNDGHGVWLCDDCGASHYHFRQDPTRQEVL
jgi:hypothetical protein